MLASKGIKLFAVIDHSGEAHAAGLELRETRVVIFGSPAAGTSVMDAAPLAALDLPLKLLVWAEGDQTRVSYAPSTRFYVKDAGVTIPTEQVWFCKQPTSVNDPDGGVELPKVSDKLDYESNW